MYWGFDPAPYEEHHETMVSHGKLRTGEPATGRKGWRSSSWSTSKFQVFDPYIYIYAYPSSNYCISFQIWSTVGLRSIYLWYFVIVFRLLNRHPTILRDLHTHHAWISMVRDRWPYSIKSDQWNHALKMVRILGLFFFGCSQSFLPWGCWLKTYSLIINHGKRKSPWLFDDCPTRSSI